LSAPVFSLHRGSEPLLISTPHVGTEIPPDQQPRYTERALQCEDTDWFLDRLYGFATGLGASLLVPRFSRYLVDLNRPPENTPMYAGQNNTALCPTQHFTGEPLYRPGRAPEEAEVRRRVAVYWQPYHEALQAEIARLRAAHGHVVLFDSHSIKSELPWLFAGTLPHMNLGTVDGTSCAPGLRADLAALFAAQPRYTHVLDGRFKGGYITRRYGRPQDGVHAVQLEMCWRWHESRAGELTPLLRQLVGTMAAWQPS